MRYRSDSRSDESQSEGDVSSSETDTGVIPKLSMERRPGASPLVKSQDLPAVSLIRLSIFVNHSPAMVLTLHCSFACNASSVRMLVSGLSLSEPCLSY